MDGMTTNLAAIAGPSRHTVPTPTVEPASPLNSIGSAPPEDRPSGVSVSKPGLSVGENGEVVKVPAFLNKLYSMVSDHDTDDLIYWAESGDSFFVPNHERFGKELLPRFFKHANFSSFVRQLNMYGFHKVPHLQSGVLRNEAPSELWEFVNPFFKRDQPQLLARVTRKNNRPAVAATPPQGPTGTRSSARQAAANAIGNNYSGIHLLTDGTIEGEAGPLIGPTGQLADLHAIQSGINAIRQTQAAIGADLKALQTSNEHLWREALESRERQQKHEETIDLIVSFLERLFGTEGEGLKGLKEAMRRGGMGTRAREESVSEDTGSKKRRRLLLEDGRSKSEDDEAREARLVEIQEPPTTEPSSAAPTGSGRSSEEPWSSAGARFTSLPTDEDGVSPMGHIKLTPNDRKGAEQTLHPGGISPLSENGQPLQPHGYNQLAHYNGSVLEGADASGMNLDPHLLQTTIGSLLQSPAAAQMFLNSLNASSQGQGGVPPRLQGQGDNPNDPTMALFSPLPQELVNNTNHLLGAYNKAAGVGGDVDKLQESIDSLVRSMGLDLPDHAAGQQHGLPQGGPQPDSTLPSEGTFDDADFNVDELLDQLANSNQTPRPEDEV